MSWLSRVVATGFLFRTSSSSLVVGLREGTCRDTDGEFADSTGFHCDYYVAADCDGGFDTADFHSASQCCVCGGGSDQCFDLAITDAQADSSGNHCDYYLEADCDGTYDTDNFKSATMCCICGGGSPFEPTPPVTFAPSEYNEGGCKDTDVGADSLGYHCDYYIEADCGSDYNDDDFNAAENCCVCGGGSHVCYDLDVGEGQTDQGGYHCDYYVPDDCDGSFDADNFKSGDLCCACGGGSGSQPERPTTTPAPAPGGGPAPAPVPVGECPNTTEQIFFNGGCCSDHGPSQCPFHALCRSGGCLQPDWGDRCPAGLCPTPLEAMEVAGITTSTTTTTPPPPCPETEEDIRANGGCCFDVGPYACDTPRWCRVGGCLKDEWTDRCIFRAEPHPEWVCDAPSVALAKIGVTKTTTTTSTTTTTTTTTTTLDPLAKWRVQLPLPRGQCPHSIAEIYHNNGCCLDFPVINASCLYSRMCVTGGCYEAPPHGRARMMAEHCETLCPGPRQALTDLGTDEAMEPIREEERKERERLAAIAEVAADELAAKNAAQAQADREAQAQADDELAAQAQAQAIADKEAQDQEEELDAERQEGHKAAAEAHASAMEDGGNDKGSGAAGIFARPLLLVLPAVVVLLSS